MYTRFSRRFYRVFVDFCRNPLVDPNYQRFVKILSDCPNLTRSLHSSNSLYRKVDTTIHCENRMSLNVNYEQLLEAQKDSSILIVDVREPAEIKETGKLPGSIHIPKKFEKRYGKRKPGKDTKIIFSCRSGKRSGTVQEMMQKLGYTKVYNYTGGWQEWEKKHKKE